MSVHLLKGIIEGILQPVTMLVNERLSTGIFSDTLKIARTVLVFEKGDPDDPKSFRPISILPVFGKILKTVMKEQPFRFLVTRNIILPPNMVSGNIAQRTVTAVSSLVEKTIAGYEDNKSVALIMSELSKAFDISNLL